MKKILLILIIIIMCFTVTGCFSKPVEGNKSFDKYTGIYKLNDSEIKIVHYKDSLLVTMKNKNNLIGQTTVSLKDNKFEDFNCRFELKKNYVKVTTNQNDIPKGDYIRVNKYTTKEIYKDYIGDISYINDYNGIYENNITKIYTVRTNKDIVRFAYNYKDVNTNIAIVKEKENNFTTDIFNDIYNLNFNDNSIKLKVDSKNENKKSISGNYILKSRMKAVDIIKIFAFEEYKDNK